MKRALFTSAMALGLLFATGNARAERPRLHLGLDTSFVSVTVETQKWEQRDADFKSKTVTPQIGLGAGTSALIPLGFRLGAEIKNHFVIGARLNFEFLQMNPEREVEVDGDSQTDEQAATRFVHVAIMPFFEVRFLEGLVRPFLLATMGYEGMRLINGVDDDEDDQKTGPNLFVVGGGGGLHFFLAPVFSIDATVLASFGVGRWTEDFEDSDGERDDVTALRFQFQTLVGISGWI